MQRSIFRDRDQRFISPFIPHVNVVCRGTLHPTLLPRAPPPFEQADLDGSPIVLCKCQLYNVLKELYTTMTEVKGDTKSLTSIHVVKSGRDKKTCKIKPATPSLALDTFVWIYCCITWLGRSTTNLLYKCHRRLTCYKYRGILRLLARSVFSSSSACLLCVAATKEERALLPIIVAEELPASRSQSAVSKRSGASLIHPSRERSVQTSSESYPIHSTMEAFFGFRGVMFFLGETRHAAGLHLAPSLQNVAAKRSPKSFLPG